MKPEIPVPFLITALLFVTGLNANTLNIFSTGGKQTGTFKIAGYAAPAAYIDTVIFDNDLLGTNFTATSGNTTSNCLATRVYSGLFIGSKNGVQGKSGSADTIWKNALSFPNSLSPLDTITDSGYTLFKQFGIRPTGLKINKDVIGGYCQYASYSFITGYNNIVYFQYNNGSGERYGKLQMYGIEVVQNPLYGENDISNYDFVYTISNTTDLDSGPVGVYSFKEKANTSSFPNQSFDLLGRHVPNNFSSDRNLISIPVLFSKP